VEEERGTGTGAITRIASIVAIGLALRLAMGLLLGSDRLKRTAGADGLHVHPFMKARIVIL